MSGYREIALSDLDDAIFNLKHGRYRLAVYCFQQYAEKSAKALLEKTNPLNRMMNSHVIERVLEAYDDAHKTSDIADKARYLTGFYFNTRYPGDNYAEISQAQAQKAYAFAMELEVYFKAELLALEEMISSVTVDIENFPRLDME